MTEKMEKNINKNKMTDEARHALAEEMDRDLESFIEQKIKDSAKYREENPQPEEEEDIDTLAARLRRHPAFMKDYDPSQPITPEMEGLMAIKYETEDNDCNAISFKEDGNYLFKKKKFKWAIENYTAGLKELSPVKLTNAILYSNRAAAQSQIGNYASAIKDCKKARIFVPNHLKAINKAIECFMQLSKYTQAIEWCDEGLLIDRGCELYIKTRAKAVKLKKMKERDERKEAFLEKKKQKEEEQLIAVVKERGVTIEGGIDLNHLEPTHGYPNAKVHVDENNTLNWPVMFLYPEYGQTDFISAFNENSCFADHIDSMFGSDAEPVPWDVEHKYTPSSIKIYYEDEDKRKLIKVNKNSTLKKTLESKTYRVKGGTPGFLLLVDNSDFFKDFLHKYEI